jgi:hypothetical protein
LNTNRARTVLAGGLDQLVQPLLIVENVGVKLLAAASVALVASLAASALSAQPARERARDEAVYARVIESVADSAIHRLDFFPARAQTRAQLLFVSPNDSVAVLFAELGRRSLGAAVVVDEMIGRFNVTTVPDDLRGLHRDLMSALGAARAALDRLAAASAGCQLSVSSVQRCQSPFTSASTALSDAYGRYLGARVKIREQIRDTETDLAEFRRPR